MAMDDMRRVTVDLAERSYDVVVGRGALAHLRDFVPGGARRAVVVTQAGIGVDVDPGVDHDVVVIGDGEQHKTLDTVAGLCGEFARRGVTRHDVVIAVGGGMVTDVAGFAAAVYHRGMGVVHVATSLLGMVDAAIGGKTGVNIAEGKNLVGAFWQPLGVVCDVDTLATLPEREQRCGSGEMAKYHFLTGDDLLAMDLVDRIARCVDIKAQIVAADEREGGRRALLNYGHTLGHALETATGHRIAHGEAVAVGLVYAARLAHRLGRITADRVDEHIAIVRDEYGLDIDIPEGPATADLIELMHRDKKAVDGLTFVLDGPTGLEIVAAVTDEPVRAALDTMRR